ncbi:hypothetical protein P171DRAFT_490259 [Karstenula rhodostoma CBS 690.94]|uniref:Uncharacterized protein n=1 Tax=Karstenula rhodostoma CBS 690.94 TaxID=1392251 RepID=A0A9P4U811_9PLEO|nr:hypothetical protein P171DRAFT_490259 [Karstenula rhodostoma CBS 690.94]
MSILEVYKVIGATFTECQPHISVTSTEAELNASGPPKYPMHVERGYIGDISSDSLTTGLEALPEGTAVDLRAAYMDMWLCDFPLVALPKPAREKLRGMNARVHWLSLENPIPRLIVRFRKDDNEELLHSIMGITTLSGEQFIVDFTGAQLGYAPQDWFMPQQDYLDRYTEDGSWSVNDDEDPCLEEIARAGWDGLRGLEGSGWLDKLREVAYGVDWVALDVLPPVQRFGSVRAEAKDTFDRFRKYIDC